MKTNIFTCPNCGGKKLIQNMSYEVKKTVPVLGLDEDGQVVTNDVDETYWESPEAFSFECANCGQSAPDPEDEPSTDKEAKETEG